MADKTTLIRLSQAQLNLLEICPPQFQRLYLEQLGSPMSPEIQDNLTWGSQFHQLMQQRELGLPIDSLLGKNQDLQQTMTALVTAVETQHEISQTPWKEAEHCRNFALQRYLLTVIYDLLILTEDQAQILDWKTYLQPQNQQKLAKNWQTRLYLYVLAETSDYLPEQISMTYWFVKLPHEPQYLTFVYNQKEHQKTHKDLTKLLSKLDDFLENYNQNNINFSHFNNCGETCPYSSLFPELKDSIEDEDENETEDNLSLIIDEIEEVSI
ncbi:PD-(D/E)XK nuclease family protein [Crocosphaera sp. UHCC 0190]|uniref:PD-(D/E)XK nuclease family protein n=1 Tax=Crocosphaera sp. UHCC 0190 TaxID=3110246 RepID=UPI002B2051EF|nr:PD-(D/E)XK nuclease family protein [Crocosphaera sp. UHCC 0190]MEA5512335.1 PD-(D/E)XK nuclease family protein [Crocosphaera sp. UHCC 0190]